MDVMVDFVVDNLIWFLVGGVILLMAFVGYIAEKTNFGRKDFNQKNKDEKKDVPKVEEAVEETNNLEETEVNELTETPEDEENVIDKEAELSETATIDVDEVKEAEAAEVDDEEDVWKF